MKVLAGCVAAALLLLAGCQTPGAKPTEPKQRGIALEDLYPGVDPAKAALPLSDIPGEVDTPVPVDPSQLPPMPQPAYRRYVDAKALFDEQRYAEAVLELDKALRHDRRQYPVQRLLCLACYLSGSQARARLAARETLELNPADLPAWFVLGRSASKSGQNDQALHFYRSALNCPDEPETAVYRVLTNLYLGMLLDDLGYARAALDCFDAFDKGVAALPEKEKEHPELVAVTKSQTWTIARRRARALAKLGRFGEAADAFAGVAAHAMDDASTQTEYVQLLLLAKRRSEAIRAASAFVDHQNASKESLDLLMSLREWTGDPEAGINVLRTLVAEQPERLDLAVRLARVLIDANRLEDAVAVLRTARQEHPEEIEPAWLLTEVYRRQQRWEAWLDAAADLLLADENQYVRLQQTIDDLPRDAKLAALPARLVKEAEGQAREPYVLFLAAAVSRRFGDAQQAEAYLSRACELAPENVAATMSLGELYASRYRWQDVIKVAKRCIDAGATSHSVHWLLGQGYDGLDEMKPAEEAYLAALEINSQDRRSLRSLAELYERNNDVRKALTNYYTLVSSYPLDSQAREKLLRLQVTTRDLNSAAVQLQQLGEQLGTDSVVYRRCQALIKAVQSQEPAQYRAALEELVGDAPDDLQTREDLVRSLVSINRFDEARAQVAEMLRIDGGNETALSFDALLKVQALDLDGALARMKELLVRHPNREVWNRELAILLRFLGRTDEAIARWNDLIARESSSPQGGFYRSALLDLLAAAGRDDEMRTMTERWLALDPQDARTRYLVLFADSTAKDYKKIIERTGRWITEDPKQKGRWEPQRLSAYLSLDRPTAAALSALEWLEESPEDVGAIREFAAVLAESKRYPDAEEWLQSALATNSPARLDLLDRLYSVQLEARQFDAAIDTLKTIAREQPRVAVDERVARILLQAKRFAEAQGILKELIDRTDGDTEKASLLQVLAYAHQLQNQPDLAERRMMEAYALAPTDIGITNDLAYTWADANKNVIEARDMLRKVVGSNLLKAVLGESTVEGAYLDSLGWAYYKNGSFSEARTWLERATKVGREGQDPVIYDHLGDALWRLGEQAEAQAAWKQALVTAADQDSQDRTQQETEALEKVRAKLAAIAAGNAPAVAPTATEATGHPQADGGKPSSP